MPKALVTGGAGFVGSHLTDYLLQQGWQVSIIDNLSTGRLANLQQVAQHPNLRIVIDDIRNELLADRYVSECDVVIHLAAAVGVRKILEEPIATIETNIGGTEVLLKAARRYRRKFMLASTSEVYGKGVKFPFEEDDDSLLGTTSLSRWSYAATKAVDEFLALAYHKEADLPVVIFRLFNTVGPRQQGQYGMVLPRFVQWALRHQPIQVYGDGEQTRCFGNVSDAVRAIHQLSEADAAVGEIFNVGNNEEISIHGLAKRVIDRADSASEVRLVPYDEAYPDGFEDFRRRVPSLDKIKRVVGWQPTIPLNDTIDQIIAYYQEQANG